ncbi:MFS transporter [Ktedonobacter racemifer]|uniref:Major facilitator superfamily MFS_1 n=1 Tax=Ktedonobacter racemifer DSM 44963 TaxID=485913 RepID=D6TGY9_KTERA|nr:MFS transporter [Ktedonobacter racemifer]EFH88918.1 major facilitator superfamily MFS_1 [Ktedonobacter racemifer DSM 44963]
MGIVLKEKFRFTQALQSKPFALLWAGQSISALGNGAYITAISWQVLQLTNSAADTGLVLSAYMITHIIFLLVGGVIADTLPRRLIMLWSDIGRAFIVLFIAGLSWTHTLQFWHLIVLAVFFGIISAFFKPSYRSLPPQLVHATSLSSANALTELSDQMGTFIGPLLGASCISFAGSAGAFAFDGVTFLFSAVFLFLLRVPKKLRESEIDDVNEVNLQSKANKQGIYNALSLIGDKTHQMVAEIGEGISYVTRSIWLWMTILVVSIVNIGLTGPLEASLPKLVHDFYKADVWLLGVLGTASAIGLALGTLLVGQFRHLRRRGLLAYLAIIIASVGVIAFGLPIAEPYEAMVAFLASASVGFGFGMHGVIWLTILQELVPSDKLGRVSSIDILGSFCLIPLGYTIAGLLSDRIGPSYVFIAGGLLSLIVTSAALCVSDIRSLE